MFKLMLINGALQQFVCFVLILISIQFLGPNTTLKDKNFICEETMAVIHEKSFENIRECGSSGKYNARADSLEQL